MGDMVWNSAYNNDWESASLNQTLNTTFKTEKLSEIEDKIAEVSWKIGAIDFDEIEIPSKMYNTEVKNSGKYTAKIGLMYVSDYGFATTQEYWTTNLYNYDTVAYKKDWLFLGLVEWTLLSHLDSNVNVWPVSNNGGIKDYYNVAVAIATRPSFYLTSSVQYISGSGQESDPIRIN